jgi:hypothetical protein
MEFEHEKVDQYLNDFFTVEEQAEGTLKDENVQGSQSIYHPHPPIRAATNIRSKNNRRFSGYFQNKVLLGLNKRRFSGYIK